MQIGAKGTLKSVNKKKKTLIFFKKNFRKAQKRGGNAPKPLKTKGKRELKRKNEKKQRNAPFFPNGASPFASFVSFADNNRAKRKETSRL